MVTDVREVLANTCTSWKESPEVSAPRFFWTSEESVEEEQPPELWSPPMLHPVKLWVHPKPGKSLFRHRFTAYLQGQFNIPTSSILFFFFLNSINRLFAELIKWSHEFGTLWKLHLKDKNKGLAEISAWGVWPTLGGVLVKILHGGAALSSNGQNVHTWPSRNQNTTDFYEH